MKTFIILHRMNTSCSGYHVDLRTAMYEQVALVKAENIYAAYASAQNMGNNDYTKFRVRSCMPGDIIVGINFNGTLQCSLIKGMGEVNVHPSEVTVKPKVGDDFIPSFYFGKSSLTVCKLWPTEADYRAELLLREADAEIASIDEAINDAVLQGKIQTNIDTEPFENINGWRVGRN